MKDFHFTIPQDVIFGKGSFERLPEILRKANWQKCLFDFGSWT